MVITYLEKIKDKYLKEKIDIDANLIELLTLHKENVAFIKLLENDSDTSFEVFTPRTVNSFHEKKIEELRNEQKMLETRISELENIQNQIKKEIEEVTNVIKVAKDKLI